MANKIVLKYLFVFISLAMILISHICLAEIPTNTRTNDGGIAMLTQVDSDLRYTEVPPLLSHLLDEKRESALLLMTSIYGILISLLVTIALFHKHRSSIIVGLSVTGLVAIISAFFMFMQINSLFGSINDFARQSMGEIQNINLKIAADVTAAGGKGLGPLLADSLKLENIVSIEVKAPDADISVRKESVQTDDWSATLVHTIDPVYISGEKWGNLYVGLSLGSVEKKVNRTMFVNIIIMFAAFLTGIITALIVRYKFIRPLFLFTQAVERLREGDSTAITSLDSEMMSLAVSLEKLNSDLSEKQRLIDLREADKDGEREEYNAELTRLHMEKISEMEENNPDFKEIRRTEAIGNSPAWLRCLRDASIRAKDREPVVIYGLTGSGKTGIAHIIHALSPRSDRPMGEFNCAEFISGDPLVTLGKLFGFGRNSGIHGMTGGAQSGILEQHDGGTIFLDEVELLPEQAQQLLLLPLEGRPFNPAAGQGSPKRVNVRFVFATNEHLDAVSGHMKIRKDFLRRIQARGIVNVPPLDERRDDIIPLSKYFLSEKNKQAGRSFVFDRGVAEALSQTSYSKYNVSELKGLIDHAFDNAEYEGASIIAINHFDRSRLHSGGAVDSSHKPAVPVAPAAPLFDEEDMNELKVLRSAHFHITKAEKFLGYSSNSKTLTNHFRGMIYRSLESSGWIIKDAVQILAGPDAENSIKQKIHKKVGGYLRAAFRSVGDKTTAKLFNNLSQKNHCALNNLFEAVKAKKITEVFE